MFLLDSVCGRVCLLLLTPAMVVAQPREAFSPASLDVARSLSPAPQASLPEQYLWTAGDVTALRQDHASFPWSRQDLRTEPHFFRARFAVSHVPQQATLYLAGPRDAEVFLNGQRLVHFASDLDAPIGIHVFHAAAAKLLRSGMNLLAIRAVRGRGIVSADSSAATSQLTYGEVLAVKLLAAPPLRPGTSLLVSDQRWRSTAALSSSAAAARLWTARAFDDSGWATAASLGPIESSREFRQWSADAGMYAWPGYDGISRTLGTYPVFPVAVTHVFSGAAILNHLDALTATRKSAPFTLAFPASGTAPTDGEAPTILLDFGREIAGRLLVASASHSDAVLSIAYGESELEALATGLTPGQKGGNYLGTNLLEVPAHGEARGPKSAFRYARIRFLRGGPQMILPRLEAEGIAYPVTYAGSFASSDPLLNRIWETGAYTVHLCMQDDLWDAPKRDRGRWAGDIDVEGRVISEVFGDKVLLEQTLAALGEDPPEIGVNGIPNYSPLWITSLAALYAHSGDLDFLRSEHTALLHILASMDHALDSSGAFSNSGHHWLFVDWSPGLYGTTPAAVFGTNLQYLRGYRSAVTLLQVLGDLAGAEHARATADRLTAALANVARPGIAMNHDWQLRALEVQLGLTADAAQQQASWSETFSHVKQDTPDDPVISPYFNVAVLDAMSRLGHAREALAWLRAYWGGMLAEDATSFWESYDLRWPKDTPHLSLQADGTAGFFVSLAHGWSAGPTAWLNENVLGVRDPADGYRRVVLGPRLLGLAWAKGAVATPFGNISVSLRRDAELTRVELELPPGVEHAGLSLESSRPGTPVLIDGKSFEAGGQSSLPELQAGKHTITYIVDRP